MKIVESWNEILENRFSDLYLRSSNLFVRETRTSIIFLDTSNAGKRGKTCSRYHFSQPKESNGNRILLDLMTKYGNNLDDFFKKMSESFLDEDSIVMDSYKIYRIEMKAINVFNHLDHSVYQPLKNIPKKWNAMMVVRALLNGQATELVCSAEYTDDYLGDYLNDFGKGEEPILEFCKDIIEESSDGWKFRLNEDGDILHAACHSFKYMKMKFSLERSLA